MLDKIKSLLGLGPKVDIGAVIASGGIILDVRSPSEYASGHIKGSINIPVNELSKHFTKLKKDKAIVTCCASGMRSGMAKQALQSNGFKEVYNGGSWYSLKKYEK